ncbi:unnamed protein product [marine sediment metagenome]|uniref:Uncharacterized protein n=1 Tax=marine sediment metagenome TaxID=412755 RepID=X1QGU7_9ZZZZ
MGKVTCRGKVCVDEETGAVFFLPDPECSPKDYVKVKEASAEQGIAMLKPNYPNKKIKK